jgi:MFS family permease
VFGGAASALRIATYRRYFIGHFVASVGRWMYRMSIGWLAWDLTGSTVWLGAVAFADLAPTAILTPVAGAAADRFGTMRIIRASLLLSCILPFVLGLLTISQVVTIEMLLIIALVNGCAESFGQPARLSVINALVPKHDLSSAIALGSTSFNASRIVGPSIAGLIIVKAGVGVVMLLCSLGFIYFWNIVRRIKIEDGTSKADRHGLLSDIVDGFVYTLQHKGILYVMILLTATSMFIRPVIEMLPGLADQVFRTGPQGLSTMLAAIGIGAVTAAFGLARRGRTHGLTRLLVLSTFGTGIAVALAMQFTELWLAAIFFCCMGIFMLIGNVSAQTLIQNSVAPEYRARVMGLFIMFGHGLPAVGALVQGWVANYVGLQVAVGSSALLMLGFGLWSLYARKVMKSELERDPD